MRSRSVLISLVIAIIAIIVSISSIYVSIHLFELSNKDILTTSRFEKVEKRNLILESKIDSIENVIDNLQDKNIEFQEKIDSIEKITTTNYKTIMKWRKSSQIMFP